MCRVFRKAVQGDSAILAEIYHSHIDGSEETGFLVGIRTPAYFKSKIHQGVIYVAESNEYIEGFIELGESFPDHSDTGLHIHDGQGIDLSLLRRSTYIDTLAVAPRSLRSGVASFLYSELEKVENITMLTAFILTKPEENKASLEFHRNSGFKEAAIFDMGNHYALGGYQSRLFFKFTQRQGIPSEVYSDVQSTTENSETNKAIS